MGFYEPAIFVIGERIVDSARAAQSGLAAQPGCEVRHRACFAGEATERGRHVAYREALRPGRSVKERRRAAD